MRTQDITEARILSTLRSWSTAEEVIAKLGASSRSVRKVHALMHGLWYAGKIEVRPRKSGGRGRPPKEYRRKS